MCFAAFGKHNNAKYLQYNKADENKKTPYEQKNVLHTKQVSSFKFQVIFFTAKNL